jgi:predicted dehydrogenase
VYYDEIEIVRRLVAQGRFGRVYYAEGDYVHDCNGLWYDESGELTWRGRGYLGVYATHGIGPLLAITGDRVKRVRSTRMPAGIVHPGVKAATMYLLEMETVTGAVFRSRVDTHSPRPHVSTTSFVVQGTAGSYESAQSATDAARIWLQDTHEPTGISGTGTWHPLADFADATIPDRIAEDAPEVGHGTSEYWLLRDFCAALREGGPMPIDIHAAMDMTLPCILARDSADRDGAWIEVPDSREW